MASTKPTRTAFPPPCVDCGSACIHALDCPRRAERFPLGHRVMAADRIPTETAPDSPSIELGHVVVNTSTGIAGRVREISPVFGPFDDSASVTVEVGRAGERHDWLRQNVLLATEWQAIQDAKRGDRLEEFDWVRPFVREAEFR